MNISVDEGEFLVLVGPSGCGRSTLLNMITGLESITSGEVFIGGRSVNGVHPSRRNIEMVFQSYALYPNMTVGENITFGLEMHRVPKPERERALADVARLLQIERRLQRKLRQLSGGQRQRVAMGRALVRNPDIFLFDEPLSTLDARLRVDLRTEIKEAAPEARHDDRLLTHDQIEAMTLSTRIAVMNDGHVQQLGTPQEVYDNPANLFVAGFMGSPSMNLMRARIRAESESLFAEIRDSANAPQLLEFSRSSDKLRKHAGKDVILGLRPEAITDPDGADRKSSAIRPFRNIVTVIEPAGSDTFVAFAVSGRNCIARMRADIDLRPDEPFDFAVNMEKALVFDPASGERLAA